MSGALGIAAADSELVFSHIAELQFSYYTSAEIARLAVCSVEQAQHSDALGHAVRGGLYDTRMGVSDFRAQCGTCHLNGAHCPGHLGRIDLLLPAYQPLTFRWLVRLLRFKCFHCNRLRLPHARSVLFLDAMDALATGNIFRALALLPLSAQHVLARGFGFQELLGVPAAADDANALAAAIAAAFEKTTAAAGAGSRKRAATAVDAGAAGEAGRVPSLAEAPAGRALEHTNRIINAVRKEIVKLFTVAAAASHLCANCGATNPTIKPDADCVKLFASIHPSREATNAKRNVRLMPDFSVRDASAPLVDDSVAAPKLSLALAEQAIAKEKSAQKRALLQAAAARAADLRGDSSTKKKRKKKHDDDDDDNDDNEVAAVAAAAAAAAAADDDNNNNEDDNVAAPEVLDDKHMYLAPAMVREHLRALWSHPVEARLLNHVFGGGGDHGGGAAYEIFFLDCLAVPANRFRVMKDEGSSMSSQDVLFTNVLRAQDRMRDALGRRDELGDAQFDSLIAGLALTVQKNVNDLFDKEADPRKPGPTGVRQVLEKKDGLFRMHIMGKRVNHAARSVISPDVNLATNEIGLPLYFATHLTVPEPVCGYNHERLVRAVINGADVWPGATQVKFDNELVRLDAVAFRADRERRVAIARRLASGTPDAPVIVHRHVLNNDFVLMNRQPTLHRPSIMAHRIRVLDNGDKVLRMHYANCNVYNADFDGDEMNCHRPQDLLASAEAAVIVNADEQYCGPRDGQPARGLIQDHVSSGVLLTQKDTFLTREQFYQLIWAGCQALERDVDLVSERVGGAARLPRVRLPQPAILKPRALWTGKQVVRCVLEQCVPGQPPLTMRCAAKTKAAAWRGHGEEATVVVHQHDLVTGVLDKNQFGASAFGLVHAVFEVYGGAAAGRVLSTLGRLLSTFLQGHGFTCGIADLLLTPKAERERAATLRKADATGIAAAASFVGLFDDSAAAAPLSGSTDAANVALISRQLRALLSSSAPAAKALDSRMTSTLAKSTSAAIAAVFPSGLLVPFPRNNMTLMTTTGAKGSQVNAAQISGLLGSQELEGRRVPLMASGKSLPCFEAYSPAARAGGYVTDRFLTGIRPQEYYFHCVPEDHEILTERGFMDLDAYERAVAAGESVRVAGYDPAAKQMVFEAPLRLIVNATATQTLIEFSSVHEMLDTWAANCGDYGLVSSSARQRTLLDRAPNHMSLLVTPGHMMYAQLATSVPINKANGRTKGLALKESAKRSASGGRQKEPHSKHTADSLLDAEGARHLAVCSEGVRSASDVEFEFVRALVLSTTAQHDAFLELYGFFIGDGTLLTHVNSDVKIVDAICFNQCKRGDVDFLLSACVQAGLERDVDFKVQQTADNRTMVRIVKPTWTAYFGGQYGHKYRHGDNDDDDDDDDDGNFRLDDGERHGRTDWTAATMRELALPTNVPIVAQASPAPAPARVDAVGVPYDAVSWAGGSYMAPEGVKSAKWFWHWVWTLDKARLRRVLDGLWRAEGIWSRKDKTIYTSSARFRDELVRVLLMAGYSARFAAHYVAGADRGIATAKHTSWAVKFAEPDSANGVAACMPSLTKVRGEVRERTYTGRTWCFEMPSGFIMTRRAHKSADGVVTKASRPIITGNCMAGREGLVDTAVKTSRSGYLQRCLIKHLESVVVSYDATVRDTSDGSILQFMYGDDSLDIATGAATFIGSDAAPSFEFYVHNYEALAKRWCVKDLLKQEAVRRGRDRVRAHVGADPVTSVFAPTAHLESVSEGFKAALDAFVDKARQQGLLRTSRKQAGSLPTVDQFRDLMHVKYMRAAVPAGEAVGVLASQSIGEPSTQMTLNTFHLAGRGDLNVTLGIPRLREILMTGAKVLETPSMRIALVDRKNAAMADKVSRALSRVLLVDVLHGITVDESLHNGPGGWARRYKVRLQLQAEAEHADRCTRHAVLQSILGRESANFATALLETIHAELTSKRKFKGGIAKHDIDEDSGAAGGGGGDGEGDGDGDDGAGVVEKGGAGNKKRRSGDDDDADADGVDDEPSESASESADEFANKGDDDDSGGGDDDADDEVDDDNDDDGGGDDDSDAANATQSTRTEDDVTTTENPADSSTSAADPSDGSGGGGAGDEVPIDVCTSAIPPKRSGATSYLQACLYSKRSDTVTFVLETSLKSKMVLMLVLAELAAQETVVRHVSGVQRAVVVTSPANEFEVQTEGINLWTALKLSPKIVDMRTIYCNSTHRMIEVFGIEAGRASVVRELGNVFGAYGINVDRRHIHLIADSLTRSGDYCAFNRNTFFDSSSPIQQMTFETVTKFVAQASLDGLADACEGASARIAVGLPIRNGTGMCETLLDIEALARHTSQHQQK